MLKNLLNKNKYLQREFKKKQRNSSKSNKKNNQLKCKLN